MEEKKVYAQLSDSTNQQPATTDGVPVTFNTNDFISGISHDTEKNSQDIVIEEDGVYFIVAAGQIGGEPPVDFLRFIDLWLNLNGKNVENTNVRASIPASLVAGNTYVLVCQSVMPLKKGDVLRVMLSVSVLDNGLGLIMTQPMGEPVVPSIIFSMYKI
jgi:hypothetical protein